VSGNMEVRCYGNDIPRHSHDRLYFHVTYTIKVSSAREHLESGRENGGFRGAM